MYPSATPSWRKSSRSGTGENCVEVARMPQGMAVRDSKDPDGPKLAFTGTEWRRFLDRVRAGEVG